MKLMLVRLLASGCASVAMASVDGEMIGESAPNTFFYRPVAPGKTTLSTESAFGGNDRPIVTRGGQNYDIRQAIRFGVFVGGAKLAQVDEAAGHEKRRPKGRR